MQIIKQLATESEVSEVEVLAAFLRQGAKPPFDERAAARVREGFGRKEPTAKSDDRKTKPTGQAPGVADARSAGPPAPAMEFPELVRKVLEGVAKRTARAIDSRLKSEFG